MNFRSDLPEVNKVVLDWPQLTRRAIRINLLKIGHDLERDPQGFIRIVNKSYKLPWERRGEKFSTGFNREEIYNELEL